MVAFKTWQQWVTSIGQQGAPNTQVLVDILQQLSSGGALLRTAQKGDLNIIAGSPKDSVDFTAYAGKQIIGVYGIVASTGQPAVITSATGFTLTPANDTDALLIGGSGIGLANTQGDFNIALYLTGAGSTCEFNTGYFSSAHLLYIDTAPAQNQIGMILLTTVGAQTDYTDSSLLGVNSAFVVYGQLPLDPSQYTLNPTTGTISLILYDAVEAGLQLVIFPA